MILNVDFALKLRYYTSLKLPYNAGQSLRQVHTLDEQKMDWYPCTGLDHATIVPG